MLNFECGAHTNVFPGLLLEGFILDNGHRAKNQQTKKQTNLQGLVYYQDIFLLRLLIHVFVRALK